MMLPQDCKPQLVAASPKSNRPILAVAYWEKEKHTITMTDGRMLLRLPVTLDEDDEGPTALIPIDVIKEAIKGKKATPYVGVKAGRATLLDGRSWPLLGYDANGKQEENPPSYPNYKVVLPRPEGWRRRVRLCINAELLASLQEAAAGEEVTLEFETDDGGDATGDPIIITTGQAQIAVLAPKRLGDRYPLRTDAQHIDGAHDDAMKEAVTRGLQ